MATPAPRAAADAERPLARALDAASPGYAPAWDEASTAGAYRPRAEFLSFSPHSVGEEEVAAAVDALRSPWITTGPRVREFEAAFAAAVDAESALAVNSCTAALHLALAAWGIGPGDEVITTPMTFAASVNVIEHVGARPVLVDVESDTLTIDPEAVARAITARTRAILPVHYAGHPADLAPLRALAERHGVRLLEDAAHAFPAAYDGRPIGAAGSTAAFSFYATKNLTTAEGGMLTGDRTLVDRARVLSLHGMSRDAIRRYEKGGSWHYEVLAPGFKYNMTDVAAAIGRVQLARQAALHARRCAIVEAYQAAFRDCDALELPVARPGVAHAWHLFPVRIRAGVLGIDRDRVIEELTRRNIGTSVHFIPVHVHPYYRDRYGFRPDDFPVAYDSYCRLVSLPLSPSLAPGDVADVIGAVHDVLAEFRR